MEVIIAVIILTLIVLYLYQSVDMLKKANTAMAAKDQTRLYETRIKKLFLLDLLQVYGDINVTATDEKDFDLVQFRTQNSLHGLASPDVAYLVTKPGNNLVRVEGIGFSLPLNRDSVYQVKYDTVMKNMEYFKLYPSKTKGRVLVVLKRKNETTEFFEVLVPDS